MTPEEALPPRHEQRRLQLRSEPAARRAGAPGGAPVGRLPARRGAAQEGAPPPGALGGGGGKGRSRGVSPRSYGDVVRGERVMEQSGITSEGVSALPTTEAQRGA